MEPLPIQAAAEATGLSAHTLRYYERSGLIEAVPRAANGYRAYSARHIAQLRSLKHLRGVGMSIRQIERFMLHYRADEYAICYELLQAHQAELAAHLENTHVYLNLLDTKLRMFRERAGYPEQPLASEIQSGGS